MVAPFRRKHALEQTCFTLREDGFSHLGLIYNFQDVIETTRFRQRLETKVNFQLQSITHSISVAFAMKNGERIVLTEEPTFFSKGRPENVEKIETIFRVVSENSFTTRLQKYLQQLQTHQYFEYSGWRFCPLTDTIVNLATKHAYSTRSAVLLKNYGYIEIRRSTKAVRAFIDHVFGGQIAINTLRDTDVFFTLFEKYFGLVWKTSRISPGSQSIAG